MKYLYLICSSIIWVSLTAQVPAAAVLSEVNALWQNYPRIMAEQPPVSESLSEREKISYHLQVVYDWLSKKPLDALNDRQKANRLAALAELQSYTRRGLYPQNISHPGRQPVFIDHRGVHCAVGYLIARSGQPDLSKHISQKFNYAYLADMDDPALTEWVDHSGFTAAELALIQPGYPKVVTFDTMKGGVNRPVYSIIDDQQGGLLVGGLFDSAGTISAPFFTHYINGIAGYDWISAPGAAPDGAVMDALWHNGDLYIAGHFYSIDTVYTGSGVARWDGSRWHGLGDFYHGALPDQVYSLAIFRDTLYAGGWIRSKPGAPQPFHGLAKWDGSEWRPAIRDTAVSFFGPVYDLLATDSTLFVGGDFGLTHPLRARNFFGISDSGAFILEDSITVPVNALEWHNGELYAGTHHHTTSPGDTGGLMVYRNQQWQRLAGLAPYGQNPMRINCLESTPWGLAIGGSFSFSPMIGEFGHNYGLYRNGYFRSLGSLDSAVLDLYYRNDNLYVGGFFQGSPVQPDQLGFITAVNLRQLVSLPEHQNPLLELYPNPASAKLKLNSKVGQAALYLKLYNINGALCRDFGQWHQGDGALDLSGLESGSYILEIQGEQARDHQRVLIVH